MDVILSFTKKKILCIFRPHSTKILDVALCLCLSKGSKAYIFNREKNIEILNVFGWEVTRLTWVMVHQACIKKKKKKSRLVLGFLKR